MARDLSANKVPPEDYMKFLEKLGAKIEQQGKETNDRIDQLSEKVASAVLASMKPLVKEQVQEEVAPLQRSMDELHEAVCMAQSELTEIQGQPSLVKDGRMISSNGFYCLDSIMAVTDKEEATPTSVRKAVKHFLNSKSDDWIGFTYARGFRLKSGKLAVQLGIAASMRDTILSKSYDLMKVTGIALRDNLTENGIAERNNLNKRFDILKEEGFVPCWRLGAVLYVRERQPDGSLSRAYPAADVKGYGSSSSDGGEKATGKNRGVKPEAQWQEQKGRDRRYRQRSSVGDGSGRSGGRAGGDSDRTGGRGHNGSVGHGGAKGTGGSHSSDPGANGKSPPRTNPGKRDNDVPNTALKYGLGIRDHKKPDLGTSSQDQRRSGVSGSGRVTAGEGGGGGMEVDSERTQRGAWRRAVTGAGDSTGLITQR